MMKRCLVMIWALGLFSLLGGGTYSAAAPHVPENIFQWVQASPRVGYFFNKEQICYGVDEAGYIDENLILVPVLEVFDAIQIDDVVQKRRWRGESLTGYEILVGQAEYLTFDLARGTVLVREIDHLDRTWTPLTKFYPNKTIVLADMAPLSIDRSFYEAILAYAKENRESLLSHTKGIEKKEAVEEKSDKANDKKANKNKDKENKKDRKKR